MGKSSYNIGGSMELGAVNLGFEGEPDLRKAYPPPTTDKEGEVEEGDKPRKQWGNSVEFLMSCIAMSVGLGNVWRFPFTAYENGGGAFLIPYIIVLLVIGKPLYYMEMAMGQFSSYGCIKVWAMVPGMRGVGMGQIVATALVLTYYCALMAITAFYFVNSFSAQLPWSVCMPEWAQCLDSLSAHSNATGNSSSSELFYSKFLLNELDNINDGVGIPDWRLTICLAVAWLSIFLLMVKGVQSSGKAAYFLALFPYVVLICLLIRGCTLPGALKGILFFIEPKWDMLIDPKVWYAAVSQAFFSLGVCFGSVTVYSSYNDFNHNIHRDALIVTSMDTLTSLLAGCTIFSILGNLAYELDKDDIADVVKSGAGLAFISYPDAIAKFDFVPQLFSVLFFLMLYTLGIGSAVALANGVITIIKDQFPSLKFWAIALVTCVCGFLAGLVYITPGGQFILNLVDYYGVTFPVFILATVEMISLAWIYGVDNFCRDIEFMLGHKVTIYWRICWKFLTPVLLLVILIYSLINMSPLQYAKQDYPTSAIVIGWLLLVFGVIQFPAWLIYHFYKNKHLSLREMFNSAVQPSQEWGPRNSKTKEEWKAFKDSNQ